MRYCLCTVFEKNRSHSKFFQQLFNLKSAVEQIGRCVVLARVQRQKANTTLLKKKKKTKEKRWRISYLFRQMEFILCKSICLGVKLKYHISLFIFPHYFPFSAAVRIKMVSKLFHKVNQESTFLSIKRARGVRQGYFYNYFVFNFDISRLQEIIYLLRSYQSLG